MCGRFVSSSSAEDISRYFGVAEVSEQALEHSPNYNTAPTTDVFVVYSDGSTRRLDTFHWGLVPRWAKDIKIGNRLINARAETVAEKPSFRAAFKKRRCEQCVAKRALTICSTRRLTALSFRCRSTPSPSSAG